MPDSESQVMLESILSCQNKKLYSKPLAMIRYYLSKQVTEKDVCLMLSLYLA